jgi:DNA-binding PadR family transcriptional regulator
MALAHAILALLVQKPMSGYDLTKAFERSVGYFWQATHQQIYRELGKLEAQGWIEAETVPQVGRPDKKLYTITDLGHQNLTAWIAEPCEVMPVKDELLVKVFVGSLVPHGVIRQQIQQHRQLHQKTLDRYQKIEAEEFSDPDCLAPMLRFGYLTLRRGIRYETEYVEWCDEVLRTLDEMEGKTEG